MGRGHKVIITDPDDTVDEVYVNALRRFYNQSGLFPESIELEKSGTCFDILHVAGDKECTRPISKDQ